MTDQSIPEVCGTYEVLALRKLISSIPQQEDDDFNNLSSENQRRFRDALLISDQSTTRGDGVIREFANRIGVDFEPLSELGTTSSAVRGRFAAMSLDELVLTSPRIHSSLVFFGIPAPTGLQ